MLFNIVHNTNFILTLKLNLKFFFFDLGLRDLILKYAKFCVLLYDILSVNLITLAFIVSEIYLFTQTNRRRRHGLHQNSIPFWPLSSGYQNKLCVLVGAGKIA